MARLARTPTCHPDRPHQARGLCKTCYTVWHRALPHAAEAHRKEAKRAYHRDPERGLARAKKQQAELRKLTLNQRRNRTLKFRYGITIEDHREMMKRQDGRCALCRREPRSKLKPLAVDHDHKTGKVRGLLCGLCNGFLGKVEADPTILERITPYLIR